MIDISVINSEISDDIEYSLKFTQDLGINQVEIHRAFGKNIENINEDEAKQLNGLLTKYDLQVSCLSSTLFLRTYIDGREDEAPEIKGFTAAPGNFKTHMDRLPHIFRIAEILDTPFIRVFGFQKISEFNDVVFAHAVDRFSQPAKIARDAGYTLVMENCPHTNFGWGANAAKLVKAVNSPAFRLLWDPAGGVRAGEPDCIAAISEILPLTTHLHAKDIHILPGGGREYLAVGQGQVPWTTIMQELKKHNYSGAISLEPHYKGQDGTNAGAVIESYKGLDQIIQSIYP